MSDTIYGDDFTQGLVDAINAFLQSYPPEGMAMPYLVHWVLTLSASDMADGTSVVLKTIFPLTQPRYVTGGLMDAGREIMEMGCEHDAD